VTIVSITGGSVVVSTLIYAKSEGLRVETTLGEETIEALSAALNIPVLARPSVLVLAPSPPPSPPPPRIAVSQQTVSTSGGTGGAAATADKASPASGSVPGGLSGWQLIATLVAAVVCVAATCAGFLANRSKRLSSLARASVPPMPTQSLTSVSPLPSPRPSKSVTRFSTFERDRAEVEGAPVTPFNPLNSVPAAERSVTSFFSRPTPVNQAAQHAGVTPTSPPMDSPAGTNSEPPRRLNVRSTTAEHVQPPARAVVYVRSDGETVSTVSPPSSPISWLSVLGSWLPALGDRQGGRSTRRDSLHSTTTSEGTDGEADEAEQIPPPSHSRRASAAASRSERVSPGRVRVTP
jgi:hypothetical protein